MNTVTVTNENYGDAGANPVSPSGTVNATINVIADQFLSADATADIRKIRQVE